MPLQTPTGGNDRSPGGNLGWHPQGFVGSVPAGTPGSPTGIGQPNPGAPSGYSTTTPLYQAAPTPNYAPPTFFQAPTVSAPKTLSVPEPVAKQAQNAAPTPPAPSGAANIGSVIAPKQIANSSLWQGAPNYESQLYANMYSGNPGGVPSSIPFSSLNVGNPAQGVGGNYMQSYWPGNLSGQPPQDVGQANSGAQTAQLMSMSPQSMSYMRGAGG